MEPINPKVLLAYWAGKDARDIEQTLDELKKAFNESDLKDFIECYRTGYKLAKTQDARLKEVGLGSLSKLHYFPILPYKTARKLLKLSYHESDGSFFKECSAEEAKTNQDKLQRFWSWYADNYMDTNS